MEAVVSVPIEKEPPEELVRLASSQHWLNSDGKPKSIPELSVEKYVLPPSFALSLSLSRWFSVFFFSIS